MAERGPGWLIALVGVAVVLPSRASVPVVFTVIVVGLVSRWAAGAAAAGLDVRCVLPEWADHGAVIEAIVEVRSRSGVFMPWAEVDVPSALALGRTEPHREAISLRADSSVAVTLPLRCTQRGRHHVGPPIVRLGEPFGLAEQVVHFDERAEVTVFPQMVPLADLGLPAEFPFVEVPNVASLITDPSSVVGVRDYAPGDPMSAIHWRASARSQRLVVKEHERGESRDTIVCLDLSADGYARGEVQAAAELAITVAASVLQHTIVVQRLPAGLRCAGWTGRPGTAAGDVSLAPQGDRVHLRRMLEILALAQTGVERSLVQVLAGIGVGMSTGTTLLIITGRLDTALSETLLQLRRSGAAVTVALTGTNPQETELTAGHLWMPIYRVASPADVPNLAA